MYMTLQSDDTDVLRYFINPAIFQYAYADYDNTISIVAQYDGAYVFNKLP